ncbi:MAG TPA: CBS domain-containing protein [Dongiaceae bacterium]|nr:CBS domain-containing protein [Dongiaceae bacterium]
MGKMNVLLGIVLILLFVALVLVAAMRPVLDDYSLNELQRRARTVVAYKKRVARQQRLGGVYTLLRLVATLLLVVVILLSVVAFGWFLGVVIAVLIALLYPAIARMRLVSRPANVLYDALEGHLLQFVASAEGVFSFLRETPLYDAEYYHKFDSREELSELIQNAHDVLSDEERSLIASTLDFKGKRVSSAMTPRTVIDFIKKAEFLGPLVLDELHALGHSRLPVVDGDLDHVVGVLHLRDLLSLDVRHSATAEKVMEQKVYYIHEDDTLEHALAAFLRTRHHLFIVINENRETVGLLTLEDTMEALIGRRIVDEDDIHADLQAVARREGKTNNAGLGHIDL